MKKTIFLFILIIAIYCVIGTNSEKILKIPDDAIRFRVIANSNSEYDQKVKYKIRDEVQAYMSTILQKVDSVVMSRSIIKDNLDIIEQKIASVLINEKYQLPYMVNFGLNYFPSKEYKGITYNEGYYESLVITLGSGSGDNWWCVLFPPLCLLEAEESTEVEYTSIVKEMLDKYV